MTSLTYPRCWIIGTPNSCRQCAKYTMQYRERWLHLDRLDFKKSQIPYHLKPKRIVIQIGEKSDGWGHKKYKRLFGPFVALASNCCLLFSQQKCSLSVELESQPYMLATCPLRFMKFQNWLVETWFKFEIRLSLTESVTKQQTDYIGTPHHLKLIASWNLNQNPKEKKQT